MLLLHILMSIGNGIATNSQTIIAWVCAIVAIYLEVNLIYSVLLTRWVAQQVKNPTYTGMPKCCRQLDTFLYIKSTDALKDAGFLMEFDVPPTDEREKETQGN